MGERSIPHLRDIFGVPFDGVDRSPRSRRRMPSEPPESATCTTDPDSAVSVGSASGDEDNYQAHKKKGNKSRSRGFEETGCRTLTQRDVRHLERHLSMKKTIRKKIMRDLRQAFVEDPSEFQHTSLSPEQLREINLQNLRVNGSESDSNFLEILRDGSTRSRDDEDRDSGHGSPTRETIRCRNGAEDPTTTAEKPKSGGFWKRFTLKGRGASKR
ncbi:hypothetical protein B566_EDAN004603 [Ephemera danica]|nr:hypothetical protein B566_EDAN004603 [Ephemera danica]